MPRKQDRKYCLHRGTGQAYIKINGKRRYLGLHGTPQSKQRYDEIVAELAEADAAAAAEAEAKRIQLDPPANLSVNHLLVVYLRHAETYYRHGGKPGRELEKMRDAALRVESEHGTMPVAKFGPRALKAVRTAMIEKGLSRNYINAQINRVRRIFKWGVAEELVPSSVLEALKAVAGLKEGRSEARETEPVKPVPDECVDALLPYLPPIVRCMVELQRITGMRSDNLTALRMRDIDMTDEIWVYEPPQHKSRHRGHRLRIPLGAKSQAILKSIPATPAAAGDGAVLQLPEASAEAFLFSPKAELAIRSADRARKRKTKRQPSQAMRQRKRNPKKAPGDRYTTKSYYRAIGYGLRKAAALQYRALVCHVAAEKSIPAERTAEILALAKRSAEELQADVAEALARGAQQTLFDDDLVHVPLRRWFPHQLRHTLDTKVRRAYGLEGAQVAMGHKHAKVTEIYAESNFELARKIAREIG